MHRLDRVGGGSSLFLACVFLFLASFFYVSSRWFLFLEYDDTIFSRLYLFLAKFDDFLLFFPSFSIFSLIFPIFCLIFPLFFHFSLFSPPTLYSFCRLGGGSKSSKPHPPPLVHVWQVMLAVLFGSLFYRINQWRTLGRGVQGYGRPRRGSGGGAVEFSKFSKTILKKITKMHYFA